MPEQKRCFSNQKVRSDNLKQAREANGLMLLRQPKFESFVLKLEFTLLLNYLYILKYYYIK